MRELTTGEETDGKPGEVNEVTAGQKGAAASEMMRVSDEAKIKPDERNNLRVCVFL